MPAGTFLALVAPIGTLSMFEILVKAWRLTRNDGHWRWLLLGVLALGVSLLEAAGASLIFALLGLAVGIRAGAEPSTGLQMLDTIRGWLPDAEPPQLIALLAALTGVFFLVRACAIVLQAYVRARVAENMGVRLSSRLMAGYMQMPYATHLRCNTAVLIRNSSGSVQVVINKVLLPIVILGGEILLVGALVTLLLMIEPIVTVFAAGVMSLTLGLLMWVIQPRLKKLGGIVEAMAVAIYRIKQQSLQGIREVRLLGREEFFVERHRRALQRQAHARYLATAAGELPRVTIETTLVSFILALLIFTVLRSGDASSIVASLGTLAYVGMRLQPSLQKIAGAANELRFASAALERLDGDRQLLGPLWDDSGALARTRSTIPRLSRALEFRDVTFTYDGSDRPAVQSIDLRIEPGESIGICGPTGGGKSTLISLLTGLLTPDSGAITVDGVDINTGLPSWREQLGVVFQDIVLMDESLRRNIALGIDDKEIDDIALSEAIALARLDSFVAELPQGLDTVVGERGVRLSGGQRQRVAIARALYRRPSVIVLDEGTSALDGGTEAEFMRGLEGLRGRHTLIMVAHRLSTVRSCDRIYLVVDGRIVDQGSYEALAGRNLTFQAMAR